MRNRVFVALLALVATAAAGCGGSSSGGGAGSGGASAASPGQSPAGSPPRAAKAATTTAPSAATPTPAAKAETSNAQATAGLPAGWEIAPRANYTARQAAGQVTITAEGESPTTGYQVKLIQSPLRIWPPQWILAHKKPDGMAGQAITPFKETASFKADRKVATIVVNDASGRRIVSVAQDGG